MMLQSSGNGGPSGRNATWPSYLPLLNNAFVAARSTASSETLRFLCGCFEAGSGAGAERAFDAAPAERPWPADVTDEAHSFTDFLCGSVNKKPKMPRGFRSAL